MAWWSFIFGKPPEDAPPRLLLTAAERENHLGKAAVAGAKAKAATSARRFDEAWRHFHVQKEHYRRHAARYGMTPRQTMALDGSVHEHLANIRRLERKDDDALVHLLYCVTTNTRPTKAQAKKLSTYFSRCAFPGIDPSALETFVQASSKAPDFVGIQTRVRAWRSGS